MKLRVWAEKHGLHYQTAYRHWKKGLLPGRQLATGTVVIDGPAEPAANDYVIYARVSSSDQKADLPRQVARLSTLAAQRGLHVVEVIEELGSGLNGTRRKLLKALSGKSSILVEHRDRLARFGFDYIAASLAASGRSIMVADDSEVADDVVRDLHEVIISMCARLYGKRAAKNKAAAALAAIKT